MVSRVTTGRKVCHLMTSILFSVNSIRIKTSVVNTKSFLCGGIHLLSGSEAECGGIKLALSNAIQNRQTSPPQGARCMGHTEIMWPAILIGGATFAIGLGNETPFVHG